MDEKVLKTSSIENHAHKRSYSDEYKENSIDTEGSYIFFHIEKIRK
jgi:hypothetical protein